MTELRPPVESCPPPGRPSGWRRHALTLLLAAPLLIAAAPPVPAPMPAPIEAAHGAARWRTKMALEADLVLDMGGRRAIEGTLLTETMGGRSRLTLKDGTVAVFDGREAHVAPGDSKFQAARFHLLTWPYFLALPMKLADPGSRLESLGRRPFADRECEAHRLTFSAGTGDTPDDWYIVYSDPNDHRVLGATYIVTYFGPRAEAEKQPNAIRYDRFVTVDGVTLPTLWMFHDWMPEGRMAADVGGRAELTNLRFVTPPDGAFTAPAAARIDPLPPKKG